MAASRKPLIEPGSVLSPDKVKGVTGEQDLLLRAIAREREESGRAAPPSAGVPAANERVEKHSAHLRNGADAQVRTQASEQGSEQVSTGARERAREQARAPVSTRTPETDSGDVRFEDAVRDAIGRRRPHEGGTKASVDMSPDLSLRIKRYCLDNGNITARLLFLELATEFLEREGY